MTVAPLDTGMDPLAGKIHATWICRYEYRKVYGYVHGTGGNLTGDTGYRWALHTTTCFVAHTYTENRSTFSADGNTHTISIDIPGGGGGGGFATSPTPTIYDESELLKISVLKRELDPNFPERRYIDGHPANSFKLHDFLVENGFSAPAKTFAKEALHALMDDEEVDFYYLVKNRTHLDSEQAEIDDYVDGGYDTNTYASFNPIQQTWPNIPSIISQNDFVGWGTPGIKRNCMDYAKAQIAKTGYQISSYNASGQTFQIYTEENGVNNVALSNGLSYLLYALSNGIPVIVGVDAHPGSPNPNTDNTTDHFVVIVGMGSDNNGKYFTFYDNASGLTPYQDYGASPNNKLYYNSSTGLITGSSQTSYSIENNRYVLTMIRKSKLL